MNKKAEFVVLLLLGGIGGLTISTLLALFLGKPFDIPSLLLNISVLFAIEVIVLVVSLFFRNAKYTEMIVGLFTGTLTGVVIFFLPLITDDIVIWIVIKLIAAVAMISLSYFFYKLYLKKDKLTPLTEDGKTR